MSENQYWEAIISILAVLILFVSIIMLNGCLSRQGIALKRYNINCESCKLKMDYDAEAQSKKIKLEGL